MAATIWDRVLEPPSYGYERNGKLYVPTHRELFREFASRINVLRDRRNWVPAWSWATAFILAVPLLIFVFKYFTFPLFVAGFFYSMFFLGTHGTVWYHRYGTHRGYRYSGWLPRFLVANSAIKIIPDELYIVSHYVHHQRSEQIGDPYNVHGGWLYCFLADANHQPIRRDLTEQEYAFVTKLVDHTGVKANTYAQYLKWGSVCHPARTLLHFGLNWAFWYGAFYLLGGHGLAMALFGSSCIWAFGVRTFNYDGHGGGKDKRKDGIDFNRQDLSINQLWPGLVTGEWHNNHHLYPNGARAGFLPYQLDYAWWWIKAMVWLGAVEWYRDDLPEFLERYYYPYLAGKLTPEPQGT